MTATERLRELLDERGVEWERGLPTETIVREPIDALYVERPDGRMHVYFRSYLTPEQAIAATLGHGTCLPHFWTHDGALHVELPKLPESISVRLPALHDREVGSARVWQYTRDNGTCHDEGDPGDFCCSECGVRMFTDTSYTYTMIASDGRTIIKHPNYCPNCGREVATDG